MLPALRQWWRQRRLRRRGEQVGAAHFQLAGQLIETLLVLPDLVLGAALAFVAHLGEVLPRCLDQAVELTGAGNKIRLIETDTTTQHAAQLFAGLEHLLEDGFALAQRRVWIEALAGPETEAGQQDNEEFGFERKDARHGEN